MRRPVIAGNWKMNHLIGDTRSVLSDLVILVKQRGDLDIVVAPPFVSLACAREVISDTNIKLAGQNAFFEESGAYTGEISPHMLKDIGCEYVILGHSERREYFKETNELINRKIRVSLDTGLRVIFCIGETLVERDAGKAFDVLKTQLAGGLTGISSFDIAEIILAYEPVWAIGTGKTASDDQAEEVHAFIRGWLADYYGAEVAGKTIIQYGGSVKPSNIRNLMARENIDGVLVGGASLRAESFARIVNYQDGD